jgi:hypothetical protein
MLARREAASMCPRDDELLVVAAVGEAHPALSPSGQYGTMR